MGRLDTKWRDDMTLPCGCDWITPGTVKMCRLHSAAPELLEALKGVLIDVEEELRAKSCGEKNYERMIAFLNPVRELIAKAGGE